MSKVKIEVGQTIWLRPTINNHRRRSPDAPKYFPTEVTKVGRVYVTLGRYGQFRIEGGMQKTDLTPDYKFYTVERDVMNEIEGEELKSKIIASIPKYGNWDIPIGKLRKIVEILEEKW